jgi:hypothetical protein
MILSARWIATAVCAVSLMPALDSARGLAEPLGGGKPPVAGIAEPIASIFTAPVRSTSMAAAMPYTGGSTSGIPRYELFVGYSYLRAMPGYTVDNRLVWLHGGSTSFAYNLNRRLALVGDFGAFANSQVRFAGGYSGTVDVDNTNAAVRTYLAGPRISFLKQNRVTPFAQALFGAVHANQIVLKNCTVNCTLLPSENSFALTAGLGLDLRVRPHFSVRVVQAEYLMTRFTNYTTGAGGTQNDMRLSTGVVFRFGGSGPSSLPAQDSLSYSCAVTPASVYPGDPIAVSGSALNLNPSKRAVYTWSVDGGNIVGASETAKIDTTDVMPGTYTLKGHVSEGTRSRENADCAIPYSVKAFEPPTVSCSADPAIVIAGNPSTITAVGISPQHRPLTYHYTSTAGSIGGNESMATLSTRGAAVGTIDVGCNAVDDKGQSASSHTDVTVAAQVVVPRPLPQQLCSIHFDRDAHRPSRVNNEAKACLDEVALNVQRDPRASLAIVGNAAYAEKDGRKLATDRAINTKIYLVSEKGIDAARITVYVGSQDGRVASITLIPAEATLDTTGVTPVR